MRSDKQETSAGQQLKEEDNKRAKTAKGAEHKAEAGEDYNDDINFIYVSPQLK